MSEDILKNTVVDNPVVQLSNVHLTYATKNTSVKALEDINLSIKKGEFICILGPSGCGKSTMLNIIAGFLIPTTGNAWVDGQKIEGPDWHKGLIFQQPNLYPWLTVQDNVAFGLKMRKFDKDKILEQTSKYIELTGLSGFEESKPYELSGGMKQRVCLARALVNKPNVLLMDEPFGSLDSFTRQNMQTLKRRIWQKTGNTVVLVTHDVDEALALATRVIILTERPGRIMQEIHTDFAQRICDEGLESVRYQQDYVEIRQEILSRLSNNR